MTLTTKSLSVSGGEALNKGDVMLIKITSGTVCDKKRVRAGTLINASARDARYLIASGKAMPVEESPPEPETREPIKTVKRAEIKRRTTRRGKRSGKASNG